MSLVNVVCCPVEVSASGRALVQRSYTECGVSECDRGDSKMRRFWPTRGCCAMEKKKLKNENLMQTWLPNLLQLCGSIE
jgi:hypothetical protein